ncbi:ATP-binding protein [Streptomyces sp. Ru72]|uniref:ATP-binding protein n=1 Tax=Streptomyces sp. Ru72 TaxID=2080747 RepID=UPI0021563BF9|nr:ATP-binding protein [Streptomyces sp. Ru72]
MKSASSSNWHIQDRTAPAHEFAMRFTSTPRGARLARRLVSHRLDEWGHPYGSPLNETVTLIASELAANAVRHGHVPGRDFHVRLTETPEVVRLEVCDTRTERLPASRPPQDPANDESGRGLLLVEALADLWGVVPRNPGKGVWAEVRRSPATDG